MNCFDIHNGLSGVASQSKDLNPNNRHQLSEEQCLLILNSGIWKAWNYKAIVRFQMFQEHYFVPKEHFEACHEKVLQDIKDNLNEIEYVWISKLSKGSIVDFYVHVCGKPSMVETEVFLEMAVETATQNKPQGIDFSNFEL